MKKFLYGYQNKTPYIIEFELTTSNIEVTVNGNNFRSYKNLNYSFFICFFYNLLFFRLLNINLYNLNNLNEIDKYAYENRNGFKLENILNLSEFSKKINKNINLVKFHINYSEIEYFKNMDNDEKKFRKNDILKAAKKCFSNLNQYSNKEFKDFLYKVFSEIRLDIFNFNNENGNNFTYNLIFKKNNEPKIFSFDMNYNENDFLEFLEKNFIVEDSIKVDYYKKIFSELKNNPNNLIDSNIKIYFDIPPNQNDFKDEDYKKYQNICKKFFEGVSDNWFHVILNISIERRLINKANKEINFQNFLNYIKDNNSYELIKIFGPGGSGKSTFIKKTAYEISKDDSYLVIYRNNHIIFEDSTLNNLIDNIKKIVMNKKLIIIYDSPSKENLKEIETLENDLKDKNIKIILTDRQNEFINKLKNSTYKIKKSIGSIFNIDESINNEDIQKLSDIIIKLEKIGINILSENQNIEKLKNYLENENNKKLLVSIYEATKGESIVNILKNEYENINNNDSKEIYLFISFLEREGINVFESPIRSLYSDNYWNITEMYLKDIIYKNNNFLKIRHRLIGNILIEEIYSKNLYELYISIYEKTNDFINNDKYYKSMIGTTFIEYCNFINSIINLFLDTLIKNKFNNKKEELNQIIYKLLHNLIEKICSSEDKNKIPNNITETFINYIEYIKYNEDKEFNIEKSKEIEEKYEFIIKNSDFVKLFKSYINFLYDFGIKNYRDLIELYKKQIENNKKEKIKILLLIELISFCKNKNEYDNLKYTLFYIESKFPSSDIIFETFFDNKIEFDYKFKNLIKSIGEENIIYNENFLFHFIKNRNKIDKKSKEFIKFIISNKDNIIENNKLNLKYFEIIEFFDNNKYIFEFFEEKLKVYKFNNILEKDKFYNILANYYKKLKNFDKSKKYYLEAIENAKNNRIKSIYLYNISDLIRIENNRDGFLKAIEYCKNGLDCMKNENYENNEILRLYIYFIIEINNNDEDIIENIRKLNKTNHISENTLYKTIKKYYFNIDINKYNKIKNLFIENNLIKIKIQL